MHALCHQMTASYKRIVYGKDHRKASFFSQICLNHKYISARCDAHLWAKIFALEGTLIKRRLMWTAFVRISSMFCLPLSLNSHRIIHSAFQYSLIRVFDGSLHPPLRTFSVNHCLAIYEPFPSRFALFSLGVQFWMIKRIATMIATHVSYVDVNN